MKKEDIISKAFMFALMKHDLQKDDNGNDYFMAHLIHVVSLVKIALGGEEDEVLEAAAYLHDTLEDTNTTYEELVKEFGQEVADLVNEVTHEGQDDHIGYWFPRLHTRRGVLLKLCDRASNLSRMTGPKWDEKRVKHYVEHSIFVARSKEEKQCRGRKPNWEQYKDESVK